MNKYEKLKNIIIESNPNLWKDGKQIYRSFSLSGASKNTELTLCDCLIAIDKRDRLFEDDDVLDKLISYQKPEVRWNLKDNNLDNQSQPTKSFLTKLLVK